MPGDAKPRNATGAARAPKFTKAKAAALYEALDAMYPDAHCELNYRNPFELLVATILSAQATDVSVNKVTPGLFKAFPGPKEMAAATPAEIESHIKSIGLFRNKAKSIYGASRMIVERYGGEVPRTMDELLELPGVARKTANVVLGEAFGIAAGVVVDTHVQRLSGRFGMTAATEVPVKVEKALMELFPREQWPKLSHLFIWHGRRACKARGGPCCENDVCIKFGIACERRES
jgi:endonuclease-3